MRLSNEQQEMIKAKFGVNRLWSFSRYNTYVEQPWEYRIVYLEHKVRTSNVYTYLGTYCHDIIQDYYDGKLKYEDMSKRFNEVIEEWKTTSYHFMSEKVRDSWLANMDHYYKNTSTIKAKVLNERPVCLVLKDNVTDKNVVFIGYLDSEYFDEDGNLIIMDYKTSSKGEFTGAKLAHKSLQLKIYAMAVSQQRGIPLHKIKLRYDMMKYVNVSYLQKNGKWKSTLQERSKWVASQDKKIRTLLMENGMDIFDIDLVMATAIAMNDISDLPKEVQDCFKISNGYIDVQIRPDEAKNIEQMILKNIRECELLEQSDDLERAFPEPVIDATNKFYFEQLSPQLLQFHEGWQAEKERAYGNSALDIDDLAELFN